MFSRYQLHKLAVRGFLIGLLLWSGMALAQAEKTKNVDASSSESQQTQIDAKHHNAKPKSEKKQIPETSENAGSGRGHAIPTEATTDKSQTSQVNPQQEANDIARRDLSAQQSMADGTWQMVSSAWTQVCIGTFALVLLYFTVTYTKSAAEHTKKMLAAAEDMNDIARDATKRELRAYVHIEKIRIDFISTTGETVLIVTLKNYGHTPAKDSRIRTNIIYVCDDEDVTFPPNKSIEIRQIGPIPPSGTTQSVFVIRRLANWEEFVTNRVEIYAHGRAEYRDVWGIMHGTWFRQSARNRNNKEFSMCKHGNKYT